MAIPREFTSEQYLRELYAQKQRMSGLAGIGSTGLAVLAQQGTINAIQQQEPQPNRKLLLLGDVQ